MLSLIRHFEQKHNKASQPCSLRSLDLVSLARAAGVETVEKLQKIGVF